MSLLDKLWDDTLAGPQPESGLGRLRKQSSFTLRSNSGKELDGGNSSRSYGEDFSDESVKVTRSIMIRKPPGNLTIGNGSPPVSPAGSTPPVSPFSGNRESHRFRRKSISDVYERRSGVDGGGSSARKSMSDVYERRSGVDGGGSRSPLPPYDM